MNVAKSSVRAEATAKVKGLSFINLLEAAGELKSRDVAARALLRVPAEVRELFANGGLIATGWYDADFYRLLLRAVLDAAGERPEFARTISRRNASRDFRGIYRLLCFVLTPEALIKRAPLLFARYRQGGRLRIENAEAHRAEACFEECHSFDAACWQEALGAMESVLEACGARNVALTVLEGAGDNDHSARIEARWTPG